MGPEGADIYDEGLLNPPCRLLEGGQINALLMEIVKANSRENRLPMRAISTR